MKNNKLYIILFCILFFSFSSFSQTEFKKINFELLYSKKNPIVGANIVVENSNPIIGTSSDLNGKAELDVKNENAKVLISYLGPSDLNFEIVRNTYLIKVNIQKNTIIFYNSNLKKIKRVKIE
ncbi:hypothetical protein [Flavobacterium sp.]|uniref:hypothetical protein n=1 Tax=Flavobacterium sp. TaxID=239 RepID=UPI003529AA11